jgi:uncharacterized protein
VPVFRSPHAAEYTARGVANGVFWGLTPAIGLQTAAIVLSWFVARRLFRRDSSLVQALIWVWVNNPVTMIPMFYGFYVTGAWLFGDGATTPGYAAFAARWDATAHFGWPERVMTIATAIGAPVLVGSIPYAVAGSLLSYRWAMTAICARRRRLRAQVATAPP